MLMSVLDPAGHEYESFICMYCCPFRESQDKLNELFDFENIHFRIMMNMYPVDVSKARALQIKPFPSRTGHSSSKTANFKSALALKSINAPLKPFRKSSSCLFSSVVVDGIQATAGGSNSICLSNSTEHMAIVIVDHGSRKKDSNEMLHEFGKLYQDMYPSSMAVEVAHMEIAEPTIAQAVGKCVQQGAKTVVIAPYFLSRGRHIQEDIPALVKEAQEQYPHVKCVIAKPIGIEPLMAQIIQSRVHEALGVAP
ncbi:hypothetical protein CEUSTIGMA_g7353.t1 [Chlamydomonas eustigma]|uniref:Uncharacterized protein n=1 Tax=Chlamydomonas eustigma TaxID=1157962 RepID=A0A250X9X1_9CHLO|nr:hypothetical protein CEUSTIGMA_g7353.t1 [Chlamydomonas eustigma]|eukprot:GAX79913.1 hypothetical protein CEUSTIGMA_g7353.t1 [Chlamydomonas eustigma]